MLKSSAFVLLAATALLVVGLARADSSSSEESEFDDSVIPMSKTEAIEHGFNVVKAKVKGCTHRYDADLGSDLNSYSLQRCARDALADFRVLRNRLRSRLADGTLTDNLGMITLRYNVQRAVTSRALNNCLRSAFTGTDPHPEKTQAAVKCIAKELMR